MKYVYLRFPGGKPKAVTFSYDDGVPEDERLIGIFNKYGMKATFNIPGAEDGRWHFTDEQLNNLYIANGHEIALHGAHHRALVAISPIEGIKECLDSRLILEKKTGKFIRGMAYPDMGLKYICNFGSYEQIKNYLTDLGIVYARNVGNDNDAFMLPEDFHAWNPTAHHDNPKIFEYIDKFVNTDYSEKAYIASRFPRLLYIWGHSFEFERKKNWERIEEICSKLEGKDDVWYATNIEIFDYIDGYKRLRFSADGHKVYNPNLFEIWFDVDRTLYSIKPDETIIIP